MSAHQLNRHLEDVDKAMKRLRVTMKGIQVRRAGFKKDHDQLARSIAMATLVAGDARPLLNSEQRSRTRNRSRGGSGKPARK